MVVTIRPIESSPKIILSSSRWLMSTERSLPVEMNLRAELGVATVPLPKCQELVEVGDLPIHDDPRRSAFDWAASGEAEKAQETIWQGEIVNIIRSPR